MNIEEILEAMDELLERSWSLPLTGGRCVVDAIKVRDLIEEIRLYRPQQITIHWWHCLFQRGTKYRPQQLTIHWWHCFIRLCREYGPQQFTIHW